MSIYVGKKPIYVYVLKAKTALASATEVKVAARGALISKALLVADALLKQFNLKLTFNYKVEELQDESQNRTRKVPSAEFVLRREKDVKN